MIRHLSRLHAFLGILLVVAAHFGHGAHSCRPGAICLQCARARRSS